MPTRMRIPKARLTFTTPSLLDEGSPVLGGRVASLYMMRKNVMVLTNITNATGAANAAKNAVSPIRQLPQKEKKKREQLNINRELLL